MKNELWKPIPDFEGLYEVSNLGRVQSLDRIDVRGRQLKGKILSPGTNRGYLIVGLFKEGKMKNLYVHRLVGQAFLQNPENLPEINHIDEDKRNNRVDNLEWCDRKYNVNYGTRNERVAKALSKSVTQYSID